MKFIGLVLLVCLVYVAAEQSACQKEREEVLRRQKTQRIADLTPPTCYDDGTYAAAQCHPPARECTCVDADGKKIGSEEPNLQFPTCGCHRAESDAVKAGIMEFNC